MINKQKPHVPLHHESLCSFFKRFIILVTVHEWRDCWGEYAPPASMPPKFASATCLPVTPLQLRLTSRRNWAERGSPSQCHWRHHLQRAAARIQACWASHRSRKKCESYVRLVILLAEEEFITWLWILCKSHRDFGSVFPMPSSISISTEISSNLGSGS